VRGIRPGRALPPIVLAALAAASLYPFAFMLSTSLKSNDQFYHGYFALTLPLHWGNYAEAWTAIGRYVANSVVVTAASVAAVIVTASLAAYAFARWRFPGSGALFVAILVVLMIPDILTMLPVFVTLRELALLDRQLALVLVYVSGGQALCIFILRSFFASIPDDLMDAVHMDGAGELQGLYHMVAPLSRPILFTVAVMTALTCWNDYIWPLITISSQRRWTITLGLVTFQERYAGMAAWGPLFAGYVVASLPLIALLASGMRHFIAGLTSGAVKG
jgi:multiple sugar transport system permease protein/raffinose/stachyose/melibiose transport system permease protein